MTRKIVKRSTFLSRFHFIVMASARTVLWIIVFCGFGVNYMVRININIAMMAMVQTQPGKEKTTNSSECYNHAKYNNATIQNVTGKPLSTQSYVFDWDEKIQNLILGGFFWFHWVLQIPGGVFARKYGTKVVFGLSNLAVCILNFAIPVCAKTDYRLLIGNRIVQGVVVGVAWPSMQHLTAQWVPPDERSKFVSAYFGSSVGVAITYPLCGFILSFFSWEAVFYITGTIGVVWFIFWWILVYDTPGQHPHISETERSYIEKSLGQTVAKEKLPVPWMAIATSVPVRMILVAQWGGSWGLFTLLTQAPTYFNVILGWNLKMTGIWSGLPHLCCWMFSFLFGAFADHLLETKRMSRTNVRKLAVGVCNILQAVLVIILAYTECNSTAAILVLIFATTVQGSFSVGSLANVIDISPNFASVLQGVSGVVGITPGFISPYIVGLLTYQNQTLQQWKIVFLITSIILLSTGILYIAFGNSEVQKWNNGEIMEEETSLRSENELKDLDFHGKHNSSTNHSRN